MVGFSDLFFRIIDEFGGFVVFNRGERIVMRGDVHAWQEAPPPEEVIWGWSTTKRFWRLKNCPCVVFNTKAS